MSDLDDVDPEFTDDGQNIVDQVEDLDYKALFLYEPNRDVDNFDPKTDAHDYDFRVLNQDMRGDSNNPSNS